MWSLIGNLASIAGLIGISVANFFDDSTKAYIALGAFIGLCCFLAWRIYLVTKKFLSMTHEKGYLPISAVAKYTTLDGINIEYETVRHIQIKRPTLRHVDHNFYWSGTKPPQLSSELQTVGPITPSGTDNTSAVRLIFPRTRIYNDVEVMHLKMQLDDTDQKSEPYLSMRVTEPICLISFRVELLHAGAKYMRQSANLSRSLISKGTAALVEPITVIAFNSATKSFYHLMTNPEPGYVYKLTWPFAALPQQKRTATTKP